MKQITVPALIGASFLLAACSSDPKTVACPPLSAPEEGVRAMVLSDDARQAFAVRLNGVDAVCRAGKSGAVIMEIKLGLKLKRDLDANAAKDVVEIPILSATVSPNGQVITNDRMSFIAGFKKNEGLKYPVAEVSQTVPADARLVISLAPSY